MPYVLVQGRLDPGGEDGGGGIGPLCVSVSGMKATELAEMNSFSPSADKDDKYTVRFPQVSGRVKSFESRLTIFLSYSFIQRARAGALVLVSIHLP